MSREQLGVETTTAVRELSVNKQFEMRAPRLAVLGCKKYPRQLGRAKNQDFISN
jgi:hypothetical protein